MNNENDNNKMLENLVEHQKMNPGETGLNHGVLTERIELFNDFLSC